MCTMQRPKGRSALLLLGGLGLGLDGREPALNRDAKGVRLCRFEPDVRSGEETSYLLGFLDHRLGDADDDLLVAPVWPRHDALFVDGRAFHSSPEQVERDKVRDRVLLACGWTTVRFSGKEVIQDAIGVGQQALAIATKIANESGPRVPALARAVDTRGQVIIEANTVPLLAARAR